MIALRARVGEGGGREEGPGLWEVSGGMGLLGRGLWLWWGRRVVSGVVHGRG